MAVQIEGARGNCYDADTVKRLVFAKGVTGKGCRGIHEAQVKQAGERSSVGVHFEHSNRRDDGILRFCKGLEYKTDA